MKYGKKEIKWLFQKWGFHNKLASKEYSKILSTDNIYNFEFYDEKDGKLKQISTNSKKMRGFTVNYIIKNRITDVILLKIYVLNGYKYNEEMSDERKYVLYEIENYIYPFSVLYCEIINNL